LYSFLLSENEKIGAYKIEFYPVVLYGCDTWSLALNDEYRLRILKKTVLRIIFGPRGD
jgi:hypothetical protein